MKGQISFFFCVHLLAKIPPRNLAINYKARQVLARKDLDGNLINRYNTFVVCQVIDDNSHISCFFWFLLAFSKEFGAIKASLEYRMTVQFTPEIKLLLHLIMTSIIITTTTIDSFVETCSELKLFLIV